MAADGARLVEPDDALIAAAAEPPDDAALLRALRITTAVDRPAARPRAA